MTWHNIPPQTVRLEVVCADMSRLLSALNVQNVPLLHVKNRDELTASFCIPQSQYYQSLHIIKRFGGEVTGRLPARGSILLHGLIRRPVLILGAVLVLILTFYLPSRILFVKVSGNELISVRQIVDAASDCGVHFGALRHRIRSEKVKNQLLSQLPALKWVGINTRGCVAEISVRERAHSEGNEAEPMVTSLVAARDGIIRELTVINGNPICRVGQAVKKGELLVSGYSDCGRCIYGTRAEAEIYAQTRHNLKVSAIVDTLQRGSQRHAEKKYSLIVGKKRIKFYKGSGISDATCVRMYVEYPLILPGGFQLPVTLAVHSLTDWDITPVSIEPERAEQVLANYAASYLESQMIAGKVGQGNYQITERPGCVHLSGQYVCDEMIGQTRSEENINRYEQTD